MKMMPECTRSSRQTSRSDSPAIEVLPERVKKAAGQREETRNEIKENRTKSLLDFV
jgi:hypothetical protein